LTEEDSLGLDGSQNQNDEIELVDKDEPLHETPKLPTTLGARVDKVFVYHW
jgi:hypothetical protein